MIPAAVFVEGRDQHVKRRWGICQTSGIAMMLIRVRKSVSVFYSVLTVLLLPLAALLTGCTTASQISTRPNILILFADDQRTDTVGAWGNPNIKTPNIDRLVKRGFSFRRNYCLGGNSGAVCLPSRAMLNRAKS